ncbi:prion-inhibition and propagation-domain-containing protein [Lophiotrema nucula]|uniref:Prion-inhibition and propagation-domain-containing protein n=1 Tax=Lophiotrema nucula TaxID=690887 RepID=A0A6A5Z4K7_9PLEO|nr:prion-inhibition and propagation-domain-containing protein [Lophiotrema nucula]
MAELFGIVAAALSVAGLFNNAIDLFEYVQLGKHFDTDHQTCLLRLDIARLRLSRWGAVVKIEADPRFAEIDPKDEEVRVAKRILEQIISLFSLSYSQSVSLSLPERENTIASLESFTNTNGMQELRDSLRTLTRRRRRSSSLSNKMSWSLYKRKHFSRLLDDIRELLDGLETTFPLRKEYQQLAEADLSQYNDEQSLRALSGAATHADQILSSVAEQKLKDLVGSVNAVHKATVSGSAYVRVGNSSCLQEAAYLRSFNATLNRVEVLEATGSSTAIVGNHYAQL